MEALYNWVIDQNSVAGKANLVFVGKPTHA